jgi:hypothetical protein
MPNLLLLDLLTQPDRKRTAANCGPSRFEIAKMVSVGSVQEIGVTDAFAGYDPSLNKYAFDRDPLPLLEELCDRLGFSAPPRDVAKALAHLRDHLAAAGELPTLVGWVSGRLPKPERDGEPVPRAKPWAPAMPLPDDPPRVKARKLAVMLIAISCHVPPLILWKREPDPSRWRLHSELYLRVVEGGAPGVGAGRSDAK